MPNSKKNCRPTIILGIDPGTAITGYGVIGCTSDRLKLIEKGAVTTSVNETAPNRLNYIFEKICALLEKHKPEILTIESLFFFANAKSISAVGQSIGVVKLAAARNKIPVKDYPPLRVKMVLMGRGRAEKIEIQQKVRKILRLRKIPRPNHAADALAVAICHWKSTNGKIKKERG